MTVNSLRPDTVTLHTSAVFRCFLYSRAREKFLQQRFYYCTEGTCRVVSPRSHVRAAGPRVSLHASKDVLPDSPLGCAEAGDLDAAGSDVLVQDGRNLLVELTSE